MSDDATSPWHVRPYRAGDEPALLALFAQSFGWHMTLDQWRWKLQEAPTVANVAPVPGVWVAADAHDQPIGQYAGMPCQLSVGGSTVAVMSGADAMTDARYQRQGIFAAMMTAAHKAWRAAGFVGVIGVPTPQWGSRVHALDWRAEATLHWRVRPLRPTAILARRLGRPARDQPGVVDRLWNAAWERPVASSTVSGRARSGHTSSGRARSGHTVTQLRSSDIDDPTLPAVVDAIDARCRADGRATLVRDGAWVRWRYLACTLHAYTLFVAHDAQGPCSLAALRLDPADPERGRACHAFLVDLNSHADDHTTRLALLRTIIHHAQTHGAVALSALSPPSPERKSLHRAGFVIPRRSGYQFRCVPLVDPAPWSDPTTRWRLAGGEFDVI